MVLIEDNAESFNVKLYFKILLQRVELELHELWVIDEFEYVFKSILSKNIDSDTRGRENNASHVIS